MIGSQYTLERRFVNHRARSFLLGICLIICFSLPADGQRMPPDPPPAELGLEITLPNSRKPLLLMEWGRGATVIHRQMLTIGDPRAAGELTGVDLHARQGPDGINVDLWVVYNDLSNQEWWKDKKEKVVGQYLVRENAPVSPPELAGFGIVPFELNVVRFKNRVFKAGEGPQVTNMTTSLQVAKLERIGAHYQMELKNTSGKRVIWYAVKTGGTGVGSQPALFRRTGNVSEDDQLTVRYLSAEAVERDGIKISSVVFEDGSFEGEQMEAAAVLARQKGFKIQSPSVLERIRAALTASDEEIVTRSLELEAGLWTIPEAIGKPAALELLKEKFPYYDEKIIASLYESLKEGLYHARNHALTNLGQLKQEIETGNGTASRAQPESQVQRVRAVLTGLVADFEYVIAQSR
jgi:hypothetical protein